MRSDVLQVFATCLHAGPFLSGESDRAPEMFGVHSTYRCVHALTFARAGAPTRDGAMAERVAPWLRRLKAEDVTVLRPLLAGCTLAAQLEGSIQWGIISDGDRGIELWQPTWKARVIGRYDDAPFKVNYTGTRFSRWSVLIPEPVQKVSELLGGCLDRFQVALETAGERPLKMAGRQCVEYHHSGRLDGPGIGDMIPQGLHPSTAALSASAVRVYHLLTNPAWAETFAEKSALSSLVDNLWAQTMASFESAACAPAPSLRNVA